MKRRPIPPEAKPLYKTREPGTFLLSLDWSETSMKDNRRYDFYIDQPDTDCSYPRLSWRWGEGPDDYSLCSLTKALDEHKMARAWHGWPKVIAAARKLGLIPVEEGVAV